MYMCVRLFGCFRRPPAAETPEMSEAGRAARARHALAEISLLGEGRPPNAAGHGRFFHFPFTGSPS